MKDKIKKSCICFAVMLLWIFIIFTILFALQFLTNRMVKASALLNDFPIEVEQAYSFIANCKYNNNDINDNWLLPNELEQTKYSDCEDSALYFAYKVRQIKIDGKLLFIFVNFKENKYTAHVVNQITNKYKVNIFVEACSLTSGHNFYAGLIDEYKYPNYALIGYIEYKHFAKLLNSDNPEKEIDNILVMGKYTQQTNHKQYIKDKLLNWIERLKLTQ